MKLIIFIFFLLIYTNGSSPRTWEKYIKVQNGYRSFSPATYENMEPSGLFQLEIKRNAIVEMILLLLLFWASPYMASSAKSITEEGERLRLPSSSSSVPSIGCLPLNGSFAAME